MPSVVPGPRTLYDKVFEDHVVDERPGGTVLLYIGMFLAKATAHSLTPLAYRQTFGS